MQDVRGTAWAFFAEPSQSEAAFIFLSSAVSHRGGREPKDIYPESKLLEHFLNTLSDPGGRNVLQEGDVWEINEETITELPIARCLERGLRLCSAAFLRPGDARTVVPAGASTPWPDCLRARN